MHRGGGVANQGFGAAEADRELEDLQCVEYGESLSLTATHIEGESAASTGALAAKQHVGGVRFGEHGGIVDARDVWVSGEETGDDFGAAAGSVHAQGQGF